jgi:hypothetical protein
MDHIDRHLATAARDDTYLPCIQAALSMGKRLLNKYYSSTDQSELYRIAMSKFQSYYDAPALIFVVLHPSHKLAYFNQAGWDEDWRSTAEDIVRYEFERAYKDMEITETTSDDIVSFPSYF